jgi:hypothetical protein
VLKHVTDKVEDPDAFIERVEYLNSHRDEKSRDELRFKNGKIFDRYSAPLVDSKGRYRGRIWYFRDITARKLAEERVQYLAYYDALEEDYAHGVEQATQTQNLCAKKHSVTVHAAFHSSLRPRDGKEKYAVALGFDINEERRDRA